MTVGICGNFGKKNNKLDGQTVKTRTLKETLEKEIKDIKILECDTSQAKNNVILFVFRCFIMMIKSKNIVILPAQAAIKVLLPLYALLKGIFRFKLFYYVVGGWLDSCIEDNPKLIKYLKKCDAIFVELKSMELQLKKRHLENAVYMSKFRNLNVVDKNMISYDSNRPHRLCVFSRIMAEKGIEDAAAAVKNVNEQLGSNVYELDLFGQVSAEYAERFKKLMESAPKYIKYKGVIDYNIASSELCKYFAMLFPTYYTGEGYANTIVDSFSAALPVIATDWKYNSEVLREGIDGFLYPTKDVKKLQELLLKIAQKPSLIANMKNNAHERAAEYLPSNAIKPLLSRLEF